MIALEAVVCGAHGNACHMRSDARACKASQRPRARESVRSHWYVRSSEKPWMPMVWGRSRWKVSRTCGGRGEPACVCIGMCGYCHAWAGVRAGVGQCRTLGEHVTNVSLPTAGWLHQTTPCELHGARRACGGHTWDDASTSALLMFDRTGTTTSSRICGRRQFDGMM